MRLVGNPLFSKYTLQSVKEKRLLGMSEEIYSLQEGQILNVNAEEMVKYFKDKYDIEVPVLDKDNITVDYADTKVDLNRWRRDGFGSWDAPMLVQGTIVEFHIPFTGDKSLFECQPSTCTGKPTATVNENDLVIAMEFTEKEADSAALNTLCEKTLGKVEEYLGWQSAEVSQYREQLESKARTLLDSRKKKFLGDRDLLVKIGKPIRRTNAPTTYSVPKVRRKLELPKPSAGIDLGLIEPTIDMQTYEHILSVIQLMVRVMEYSPRAFSDMDEETLRFHFLVQLNAQYDGGATAETFNYTGKTDIIIKEKGKNTFVAECKVWKGPKVLIDTIDQIHKYLSWRDTKAAIILFNKNRGFSDVLRKIPETVKEHSTCDKQLKYDSENGFRFEMHRPDDSEKKILLTVLAFEIPASIPSK